MPLDHIVTIGEELLQKSGAAKYSPEALRGLRTAIFVSWMVWAAAGILIFLSLSGLWEDFTSILVALLLMTASRFIRAFLRPAIHPWHIRKHFYTLTYFLPVAAGLALRTSYDAPIPLEMWSFVGIAYFVLYRVQVTDDLKILKAIKTCLTDADA